MTPRYDVVIWRRIASSPAGLAGRIIACAGRKPDESSEMGRFQDFHWRFGSAEAATRCAESLLEIAALECVVYLVVSAYGDDAFDRKVYKDTRYPATANADAPH
jgi:hypothetical protein